MEKITKDILMYSLAALVVSGFFVLLYILLFKPIQEINKDILNIVIGALIGSFTTIIGYFFGSSQGSAAKQETLNNLTEKGAAQ